jgi:hypothetical protein
MISSVRPGILVMENSQERLAKKKAPIVRLAVAVGRVSCNSGLSIPVEEHRHRNSFGVIAFCLFEGGSRFL